MHAGRSAGAGLAGAGAGAGARDRDARGSPGRLVRKPGLGNWVKQHDGPWTRLAKREARVLTRAECACGSVRVAKPGHITGTALVCVRVRCSGLEESPQSQSCDFEVFCSRQNFGLFSSFRPARVGSARSFVHDFTYLLQRIRVTGPECLYAEY